jgi:hypothetical protein
MGVDGARPVDFARLALESCEVETHLRGLFVRQDCVNE